MYKGGEHTFNVHDQRILTPSLSDVRFQEYLHSPYSSVPTPSESNHAIGE